MPHEIALPAADAARIPYLEQYLGVWAMDSYHFEAMWQMAVGFDLHVHLQSQAPQNAKAAAEAKPTKSGRIGIVQLSGTLMKQASSMSGGTSTVQARRQVRAFAADPEISAILLHIDSPGGTVAGTMELARDIAAANQRKPVWAYCDDLCASAAYWIASQASRIIANDTAVVGSIGTYGVVYDYSAAATLKGIKVHVVRAGAMKGAGEPGVEITSEVLAERQRIVNELNEHFLQGVSQGRRMPLEAVRALADGRVYVGRAAVENKLIDAIETLDQALDGLSSHVSKRRNQSMNVNLEGGQVADALSSAGGASGPVMPAEQTTSQPSAQAKPVAATLSEIKAACPDAPADFVLGQLEKGATLSQAQTAYAVYLKQELDKAKAGAASQTAPKLPGVEPVGAGGNSAGGSVSGDPISEWNEAVAAKMKANGNNKARAISELVKENPKLHADYIAAWNAAHPRI